MIEARQAGRGGISKPETITALVSAAASRSGFARPPILAHGEASPRPQPRRRVRERCTTISASVAFHLG
jgi:hypothetical protein